MKLVEARAHRRLLSLALALAAGAGCSSGGDDPTPPDGCQLAPALPAGVQFSLSGTVEYDFVPATYSAATDHGTLNFSASTKRPVRNAVVEIRQCTTVLQTTTTDDTGHYSVSFTPGAQGSLSVVALAKTSSPPIQVQDNTDGNAIWAVSKVIDSSSPTRDVYATHGWNGSSYTAAARSAAPFAILDSMYTAAMGFIAVRAEAAALFPPLSVNWSPDNVSSTTFSPANGLIYTSHFSPSENAIYILGKDGDDTDEYDSHVIVHEWAHYFEANLSRSDSPGGPHGMGDTLDPRLSFGEGWATAVAGILLGDPIYADTGWWNGYSLDAFGFDAENIPNPSDDFGALNPGPFSEMSIIRVVYDLLDDSGGSEYWDAISVPIGTLYDVLVGPEKTTPALTTIASFVAGLEAKGVNAAAVNTVLANRSIGAITDAWGTGDPDLAAMYTTVSSFPATRSFVLSGGYDGNTQQQNRYLVFTATGSSATVTASAAYDVDLEAYHQGDLLDYDWFTSSTATVSFGTTPGQVYVIVLTGWKTINGTYSADVTLSTP